MMSETCEATFALADAKTQLIFLSEFGRKMCLAHSCDARYAHNFVNKACACATRPIAPTIAIILGPPIRGAASLIFGSKALMGS